MAIDTQNITDNNIESQITELYIATFNRAPDADGLNYWVEQYKNGMSLEDIAKSFFEQKETQNMYGDNDLDSFIESVYENVLDRKADSAGLEYWRGELEKGHISKDKFILAIINGAKEHENDHRHLLDKVDIGLTFVKEDLNDYEMSKTVISKFKELGDKDAIEESLHIFKENHKDKEHLDNDDIVSFDNLVHQKHNEHQKDIKTINLNTLTNRDIQENHLFYEKDFQEHQNHHPEDAEHQEHMKEHQEYMQEHQNHHSEYGEHHKHYEYGEHQNHHQEHDEVALAGVNDEYHPSDGDIAHL